jgi:DNA-binding protein Alba
MTIIEVAEKDPEEYVSHAKEHQAVTVKGKSRDTVKAVDVAELLKKEGFKVKQIKIETEEITVEDKKQRTSLIIIEMEK